MVRLVQYFIWRIYLENVPGAPGFIEGAGSGGCRNPTYQGEESLENILANIKAHSWCAFFYLIIIMLDFRLKVFYAVARNLSFTKAAAELFISQPAVTKNVKELESQLGIRLFDRSGSHISLTKAGVTLMASADGIMAIYQKLSFDLSVLKNHYSGQLQLGASTTAGQYLLPAILAKYHQAFPDVRLSLKNGNTQSIEAAILDKELEIGVVEGVKHHPQLKYTSFIRDEIVAITHAKSKYAKLEEISLMELQQIPVVCRERGSGSLEVIEDALRKNELDLSRLKVEMMLGSTEGIKSFLENYDSIGFVSIAAVARELNQGLFKVIEIKDMEILREFYFVHLQGIPAGLAQSFMDFSLKRYNQ